MSALARVPASRVAPLVRLLGSPVDAEALGAAPAIDRMLRAAGADLHALADRIEHGDNGGRGGWRAPLHNDCRRADPNALDEFACVAEWCLANAYGRLRPHEIDFLENLTSWFCSPTPKQQGWLSAIADRLRRSGTSS
jgi:hypothetical protein